MDFIAENFKNMDENLSIKNKEVLQEELLNLRNEYELRI